MEKRIISALIALATALSLCACGAKTEDVGANSNKAAAPEQIITVTNADYTLNSLSGTYSGNVKNDMPNGYGEFTSEIFIYHGDWEDGLPHGMGKLQVELDESTTLYYEGELYRGNPNGQGYMEVGDDENLESWEGTFSNGSLNGYTTWIQYKEDSYMISKGEFKNSEPFGQLQSTIYYNHGSVWSTGIYENGKYIGDNVAAADNLAGAVADYYGWGDIYDGAKGLLGGLFD